MAAELNKKQHALLNNMSQETLITIISDLVRDNQQAKSALVNGYLLAPDNVLKNIEKEYNKRTGNKRYYDYYEANAFFEDLRINVASLFEKTVSTLPEKSEFLIVKMMFDMEKLSETKDTSSGEWMKYYGTLVRVWMQSLSAQKNSEPLFIAKKIMQVYLKEHYFGIEILKEYKSLLGIEVLRELRDAFDQNKKNREAISLSLIIKDVDYLSHSILKGKFSDQEYYLEYAKLLIEEVQSDKAIDVLESVDEQAVKKFGYFTEWKLLYILALTEEGRKEDAKRVCIESFKHLPHVKFYNAYTKIEGSSISAENLFMAMATTKGTEYYIQFLNDIARFDLLDGLLVNSSREALEAITETFRGPFIRSLSSSLYKNGYALSATLLRRCLAESVIHSAQSKYYSYAVADLKKSIDYSEGVEKNIILPDTQTYLSSLYTKHKRKASLWPLMQEKIKGVRIEKERIVYEKWMP